MKTSKMILPNTIIINNDEKVKLEKKVELLYWEFEYRAPHLLRTSGIPLRTIYSRLFDIRSVIDDHTTLIRFTTLKSIRDERPEHCYMDIIRLDDRYIYTIYINKYFYDFVAFSMIYVAKLDCTEKEINRLTISFDYIFGDTLRSLLLNMICFHFEEFNSILIEAYCIKLEKPKFLDSV